MWNKLFVFILCLVVYQTGLRSQDCMYSVSGTVLDLHSLEPLDLVSIYITEQGVGTVTDSVGYFNISSLCHDDYHIVLSHVGCQSEQIFLHLEQDTILSLFLDHDSHIIEDIVVNSGVTGKSFTKSKSISKQKISDLANENLSNILETVVGVSSLKNGANLSKPVIHGLYGNRVTILNNEITQNGQQWGNDHSPEIDPLSANKISIINGVASLAYQGSQLSSVVLIEPERIKNDPHLHGHGIYFYESNGRGHGMNIQLEQSTDLVDWRWTGTLKRSGDAQTPDYYLNNTGNLEKNGTLHIRKRINKSWESSLYFSTFNADIGVLRGSHIGNLTDLMSAFDQDTPFFTEEDFSYNIESPKQRVSHNLLKIKSQYQINPNQWFDLIVSGQWNQRKEFDVRRSNRSDRPALSLAQQSYFFSGEYNRAFDDGTSIKTGMQFNFTNNTNNPETGILPLIPDYVAYQTGIYMIFNKAFRSFFMEAGARYDSDIQQVVAISNAEPREILRYNNLYNNIHLSSAMSYTLSDDIKMKYDLSFAMRSPGINELYSAGLHQGVSGIEEGDPGLNTERSLKNTFTLLIRSGQRFSLESQVYFQRIQDYIFLEPQDELRLTIRGAFPVFRYQQTEALLSGWNISATWNVNESLHSKFSYSYLNGQNIAQDLPLIFMPANNLNTGIAYEFNSPIKIAKHNLENTSFSLDGQYVFRQENLLDDQDFVPVPEAYFLLSANAATDLQIGKTRIRLTTRVDNILNTSYRDYLNRLRYFADAEGINVVTTLKIKF